MNFKRIFMLLLSLLLGISLSITFFSIFLQSLGSDLWRVLPILLALTALFSWGNYRILDRYLTRAWTHFPTWVILAWLAGSCAFGGLLVASLGTKLQPESIHFLYPRHTLEIAPLEGGQAGATGTQIKVRSLYDGEDFPFDLREFRYDEDWDLQEGQLVSLVDDPSPVVWQGSLLNRGRLMLWSGPNAPRVRVTWDGVSQEVDLYATGSNQKLIKLPVENYLPVKWVRLVAWLFYALAFCSFLFLAMVYWYSNPARRTAPAASGVHFLWYALPMVAVWTLYLLVFYPGILSPDSIHQWRMISGLEPISDWHPAIHTLLWWLVKQVWNSSAGMAVLQILALSLVSAWGIDGLVRLGLPGWGAWLMSLVFAVSPANSTMAITMWKDVFYGISLFALFLMVFRIVISEGDWIAARGRWVLFGLTAAAAALFRHNGSAVVIILLVVLLVAYRSFWKSLLKGTALFLGVWLIISGPVYNAAGVVRVSSVLRDTIFLHHFGAHVTAGTPLTQEEYDYFNALKPLDQWQYTCCNVSPLFYDPEFDGQLFRANQDKHLRMFIDLALRDPMVEIKHMICSSSLVWRVCNDQCGYIGHFIVDQRDHYQWVEPNTLGISEASLLPGLVNPLAGFVTASNLPDWGYWVWSPAFYLYFGLFSFVLFALWQRSWKKMLIAAPILVQSAIMLVATISTDFRYQYSVYLMGLFCLGLWLLMFSRRRDSRSDAG